VSGIDSVTSRRVSLCYWTCDHDGCNSARSIHYLLELIRRRKRDTRTAAGQLPATSWWITKIIRILWLKLVWYCALRCVQMLNSFLIGLMNAFIRLTDHNDRMTKEKEYAQMGFRGKYFGIPPNWGAKRAEWRVLKAEKSSPSRKRILAYFECHRTLLFAPICWCFQFIKQCFMSHWGAKPRFGRNCLCPRVELLLNMLYSRPLNIGNWHVYQK